MTPITTASDYRHLRAIDDCDILFICNKDGIISNIVSNNKCPDLKPYNLALSDLSIFISDNFLSKSMQNNFSRLMRKEQIIFLKLQSLLKN